MLYRSPLAILFDSDESMETEEESIAETSVVSSNFSRQIYIEDGVVLRNCSSIRTSGESGRAWVASPLKRCLLSKAVSPPSAVHEAVFERGSELEKIAESGFRESQLKSIVIPSSVLILGESSFRACDWLRSVVFEHGSRLERIGKWAFKESGLRSIVIPSSVRVFGRIEFPLLWIA
jgi:hypothetical protein